MISRAPAYVPLKIELIFLSPKNNTIFLSTVVCSFSWIILLYYFKKLNNVAYIIRKTDELSTGAAQVQDPNFLRVPYKLGP